RSSVRAGAGRWGRSARRKGAESPAAGGSTGTAIRLKRNTTHSARNSAPRPTVTRWVHRRRVPLGSWKTAFRSEDMRSAKLLHAALAVMRRAAHSLTAVLG